MKKILKWIFYIFLALIVIGYIAEKDNKTKSSTSSDSSASSSQPSAIKEVYKTTANQLFNDYEDNEVAADEKMKGKLIAVSGVVDSIDKDFTNSIVIGLRTSNQFMSARMEMEDSQKSTALSLKKGQKVTILCESMSRVIGSPAGRDCVFQQ
ncbi:OB-fold protein [Hafnia sp.]|uniref:OB-fold protein n=1 Tax=Hafnia sp. TaxID=1873498 RepID=UPI002FC60E0F